MAPLLEVEDLRVVFPTPRGTVRAVWGVSFRIEKGQMYGIVGESGCGKSATGRAILRLIPPPGKIVGGQVLFRGENLLGKSEEEMQQVRGRSISMIFQDPAAALNPLFTIGQQITAIMKRHKVAHGEELRRRAEQLFEELGLPHSQDLLQCYPHQLSGGMQQRVMIAMALCVESDLLIADEPTSCLDVTIQSQILDLLVRLQKQRRLAIMLITHDLGVVAETCERVAVFYLGRIVEQGAVSDVFRYPRHPYTQGLLAALPDPQRWGSPLKMIPGSVPTPLEPIPGCAFATRCEFRMEMCRHVEPQLVSVGDDHLAACFLYAADPRRGQGGS